MGGLLKAKTRVEDIVSYEYGLCLYLLRIGKNLFADHGDKVIIKAILISIYGIKITKVHFERSYLCVIYPNIVFDHIMPVEGRLCRSFKEKSWCFL